MPRGPHAGDRMKNDNAQRTEAAPENALGSDIPYRTLVQTIRDYAIFMLDAEGRVASWNTGAQLIKGYTAGEIIGHHFSRFYPLAAVERGWPEHELAVARAEGRFEDEGWRVRKDGSTFWASVIITALRDSSGKMIGFAKVTRDLTDRRREQESLRQSEERFRLLVQSVKDYAIFMLDVEGRIVSWNDGAERIKGYTASEIVGRHFSVFYPPELIAADWPAHELRIARTQGRYEEEAWRLETNDERLLGSGCFVVYAELIDLRACASGRFPTSQRIGIFHFDRGVAVFVGDDVRLPQNG